MRKPAVKGKQKTAGRKTKLKKMCRAVLCTACICGLAITGAQDVEALASTQTGSLQSIVGDSSYIARAFPNFIADFFSGSGKRASGSTTRQIRTVTKTEPIPYSTDYVDIPNMYRGYEELVRAGVKGERTTEAQVIYEGNVPVQVVSIRTKKSVAPIPEVMRRGTKVLRTAKAGGGTSKISFIRPLKTGWLSADFYDYPHHNGIDLAAPYGTSVYASAGGKVSLARWYGEYGYCVIIDHADGSQTLYAHNSKLTVRQGQTVKQGELIAKVGSTGNSTGNHLHFEIRVGDKFLDPLTYMDK